MRTNTIEQKVSSHGQDGRMVGYLFYESSFYQSVWNFANRGRNSNFIIAFAHHP